MHIVLAIVLFIGGMFVAALNFYTIILPLFYMLPKGIYMITKRLLHGTCILAIIINPVIMIAITGAIVYWIPTIPDFLDTHRSFGLGHNLYLIYMVYASAFTNRGRRVAKAKFWLTTMSHGTFRLNNYLNDEREKEKTELQNVRNQIDESLKDY